MKLNELSVHVIAKNKKLRKELYSGNFPIELKQRVVALHIENFVIKNALQRFNRPLSSGTKHGIVLEDKAIIPNYQEISFYWFGKKHGLTMQESDRDSGGASWYNLDIREGPCIYQRYQSGACQYKFVKDGSSTSRLIQDFDEIGNTYFNDVIMYDDITYLMDLSSECVYSLSDELIQMNY